MSRNKVHGTRSYDVVNTLRVSSDRSPLLAISLLDICDLAFLRQLSVTWRRWSVVSLIFWQGARRMVKLGRQLAHLEEGIWRDSVVFLDFLIRRETAEVKRTSAIIPFLLIVGRYPISCFPPSICTLHLKGCQIITILDTSLSFYHEACYCFGLRGRPAAWHCSCKLVPPCQHACISRSTRLRFWYHLLRFIRVPRRWAIRRTDPFERNRRYGNLLYWRQWWHHGFKWLRVHCDR